MKPLLLIAEAAENNTFKADWLSSKMESMIIYPMPENISCGNNIFPCIRFDFLLSGNVDLETFTSAEIWLFKTGINESIRVYEAVTDVSVKYLNANFSLLNKDKSRSEDHWIKFKIPVSSFRGNFGKNRILSIQVTYGENVTSKEHPVSQTGREKPFIILQGYNKEASYRSRRSTSSCVDGSNCCRENFYLNFAEIGWDNWILHPEGYDANFCRGRCFNDLSNTRFYHSAVLLSYIRDNKDIAEEIGLNMCCTPSVMSPISIIYQNEEGIFYHKSIENMKVESCDCA
ncbi:Inhibin beta E chain, partial [Stegodyphus mimosarum]